MECSVFLFLFFNELCSGSYGKAWRGCPFRRFGARVSAARCSVSTVAAHRIWHFCFLETCFLFKVPATSAKTRALASKLSHGKPRPRCFLLLSVNMLQVRLAYEFPDCSRSRQRTRDGDELRFVLFSFWDQTVTRTNMLPMLVLVATCCQGLPSNFGPSKFPAMLAGLVSDAFFGEHFNNT